MEQQRGRVVTGKTTDLGESFDLDEAAQRGAVLFAHRLRNIVEHVGAADEDLEGLIAAAKDGFGLKGVDEAEREPWGDAGEQGVKTNPEPGYNLGRWEEIVLQVRGLLQMTNVGPMGATSRLTADEAFNIVRRALELEREMNTEVRHQPSFFFPSVEFTVEKISPEALDVLTGKVRAAPVDEPQRIPTKEGAEEAVKDAIREQTVTFDPSANEVHPHAWQASFSAEGGYCGAMVMRNGGGDQCGLMTDDPVHAPVGVTFEPDKSEVEVLKDHLRKAEKRQAVWRQEVEEQTARAEREHSRRLDLEQVNNGLRGQMAVLQGQIDAKSPRLGYATNDNLVGELHARYEAGHTDGHYRTCDS